MLGLTPDYTPEACLLDALTTSCGVPTNSWQPLANESPFMRSNKLPLLREALSPPLDLISSIAVLAMLTISGFGCINNINNMIRAHMSSGSST